MTISDELQPGLEDIGQKFECMASGVKEDGTFIEEHVTVQVLIDHKPDASIELATAITLPDWMSKRLGIQPVITGTSMRQVLEAYESIAEQYQRRVLGDGPLTKALLVVQGNKPLSFKVRHVETNAKGTIVGRPNTPVDEERFSILPDSPEIIAKLNAIQASIATATEQLDKLFSAGDPAAYLMSIPFGPVPATLTLDTDKLNASIDMAAVIDKLQAEVDKKQPHAVAGKLDDDF